jgi:hypothetical protein
MKTLNNTLTDFCKQVGGTTPTELEQGKMFLVDAINYTLRCFDWDRTEIERISYTPLTANQEEYDLPFNFEKMNSVRLLSINGYPYTRVGYFISKNRSKVSIYPTPSKSGDWLEFTYSARQKELSLDDYKTGNITTLINGSTTVVANGTSWTNSMIGAWIKVTNSWSLSGDGEFYQIASVNSATSLELAKPYNGQSFSGSNPYLIGEVPVINPDFGEMVVFKALQLYHVKNKDYGSADRYEKEFETRLQRCKDYEASKTTSYVVENVGIYRK